MTSGEPARVPGGLPPRRLNDPRAMRAVAHPVRLALLEALSHAGTLTATQASELLGESPANCAFHLRTLAKYGYVEEAGGGRGRERPWRRVHQYLHIPSDQEDPQAAVAAAELADFWQDQLLSRARAMLAQRLSWPAEWHGSELLGLSHSMIYVTPEEGRQLGAEIRRIVDRFYDRVDHPERRPGDALPIELVQLGYPRLDLAAQPAPAADALTTRPSEPE